MRPFRHARELSLKPDQPRRQSQQRVGVVRMRESEGEVQPGARVHHQRITPSRQKWCAHSEQQSRRPPDVLGAGGLLHMRMGNLNSMVSQDLTPTLRAKYLLGYWNNDARSGAAPYLTDMVAKATVGEVADFASNTYQLDDAQLMQGLSLKSNCRGQWDGETVVTWYNYLTTRLALCRRRHQRHRIHAEHRPRRSRQRRLGDARSQGHLAIGGYFGGARYLVRHAYRRI